MAIVCHPLREMELKVAFVILSRNCRTTVTSGLDLKEAKNNAEAEHSSIDGHRRTQCADLLIGTR